MSNDGFSTVMDAVLFLALVSACAVILGPAIWGHGLERSAAERGLREMAADALCSLETARVDYFEYRILGDAADSIAVAGGINATGNILYDGLAKALLGRGCRHMTVMDIATGNAACQFLVEYGDIKVRANPVTAEYDGAVSALIDEAIRASLDSRYRYEFTLRWTPLAGVPLAGEVRAGEPCPARAVSASMQVSMPYTTGITRDLLEQANMPDLEDIDRAIDRYRTDDDMASLRNSLGDTIEQCLINSTILAYDEIWNNTLCRQVSFDGLSNPLNVLKRFMDDEVPDAMEMINLNFSVRDAAISLADVYCRAEADELSDCLAEYIADGRSGKRETRRMVLDWLTARYRPSSAVATISLWTEAYA